MWDINWRDYEIIKNISKNFSDDFFYFKYVGKIHAKKKPLLGIF